MLTKFKILPVVALGIFWMVGTNDANSNVPNCEKAYQQCQNGGGDNWWGCELYKDTDTRPNGNGKPYVACCEGRDYANGTGRSTPSGCSKRDCTSAKLFCDAQDWI